MDKYAREVLETYQALYDNTRKILSLIYETGKFTDEEMSKIFDEAFADTEYHNEMVEIRKLIRARKD